MENPKRMGAENKNRSYCGIQIASDFDDNSIVCLQLEKDKPLFCNSAGV
jgi:hypothetical protein